MEKVSVSNSKESPNINVVEYSALQTEKTFRKFCCVEIQQILFPKYIMK